MSFQELIDSVISHQLSGKWFFTFLNAILEFFELLNKPKHAVPEPDICA